MESKGAEIAGAIATTHCAEGKTHFLEGGYTAQLIVAGMSPAGERQVIDRIQLIGIERHSRRVLHQIPLTVLHLAQHAATYGILLAVFQHKGFGIGLGILGYLVVGGYHDSILRGLLGHVADTAELHQLMGRHATAHPVAAVDDGLFTHAVHQQRGGAVHQHAAANLIIPVIVMGKTTQRSFHAADEHRHAGIGFVDAVAINGHCSVRAHPCFAAGCVGILVAPLFGGGVVVHHAVNDAGGHQKTQLGLAKATKILCTVIFGQAQHGNAVSGMFQHAADDGMSKRGVIHIGFAHHIDKIRRIPAPLLHICHGNRQKLHRCILL